MPKTPIDRSYLSLSAFYASDARRKPSRERDIGLWWRSVSGPTYRAAWVQDTGEVYLFQHGLTGSGGGSVHLLCDTMDEPELGRRLAGWKDVCGKPDSLPWLLARACPGAVRRPGAPPAPDRPRGGRVTTAPVAA
jgi:hypothetical protein